MAGKTLEAKLDELFTSHFQDRADQLKLFVEQLHDNYQSAVRALTRNTITVVVTWFTANLVGYGIVEEAGVAALQIKDVKFLFLAAPSLLGVFGHQVLSSITAARLLWAALKRSYKHFLPKAYELDLELLIARPSFFDIARLTGLGDPTGPIGRFHDLWLNIVVTFIAPVAALAHVAYILWSMHIASVFFVVVSVVFGVGFWAHGLLVVRGGVRLLGE